MLLLRAFPAPGILVNGTEPDKIDFRHCPE